MLGLHVVRPWRGYGRDEGCRIIILKRLADATQDGDDIRAVIRGTGANSDGFTQGVAMTYFEAQAALIKHVHSSNGLDYSTQYVEAHGTGTKAGDPIETYQRVNLIFKLSHFKNYANLTKNENKPVQFSVFLGTLQRSHTT
ncbi:phenolpthiocerol synthesis polyketide synthase ppsB [Penicillium viridicatum]|nr:phenolpthiocerol synthesis polyketide synthase ppsB [Penicillium viridicatum]